MERQADSQSDEASRSLHRVLSKAKGSGSKLEEKVARDLAALGLMEGCHRQYRFHPERKWLIDFAWPNVFNNSPFESQKDIALEVNGGTYLQGSRRSAHSRGPRQRKDYEKWSALSMMGWTVILVDSADVRQGVHVQRVLEAMGRL